MKTSKMILLALNLLLHVSVALSCDCKLVDAMAQQLLTDVGNSIELPCDVPTTWPDNVIVTWTKYPAEKLSTALTVLVDDSRLAVNRRADGEYNLRIDSVNLLDDGKYYCKFSFGEGEDTSIIKVYRVKVNQVPERNASSASSESKRGRRNSSSSRSKSDSRRATSASARPTSAPSRWRNTTAYNSSFDTRRNASIRPDSSWIKNSTTYYSTERYDLRRRPTARSESPMWTRNGSYYKYSTKGYETLSWWKNRTASNSSSNYDSRRNSSSRPNGTSWMRNNSYGNSSRDYKPYSKPVSTANWKKNNTFTYTTNSSDPRRGRPTIFTTKSYRNSSTSLNATHWINRVSNTTALPTRTTARATTKATAGWKTVPTKATTKVSTTLRRSSRLSQTTVTSATKRTTPSRTTAKKNPRG